MTDLQSPTAKRQGILGVARHLLETVEVGDVLPPGHAIIALRDSGDGWPYVEYLIEGPHMPECEPGAIPTNVILVCRQEAEGGRVTAIYGSWSHMPGTEWRITTKAISRGGDDGAGQSAGWGWER